MLVKLDHLPRVRGENKKYLSCHHRSWTVVLVKNTDNLLDMRYLYFEQYWMLWTHQYEVIKHGNCIDVSGFHLWIWMFLKIRGTPKWMVKLIEKLIKMDDFGVPLVLETPISSLFFSAAEGDLIIFVAFCQSNMCVCVCIIYGTY